MSVLTSDVDKLKEKYNSSTYGRLRPYPFRSAEELAQVQATYLTRRGEEGLSQSSIAIVSAVTGNYEMPQRHEHLLAEADYVLVTDSPVDVGPAVKVVQLDYFDTDPVRSARFVKTHPYLYAPRAQLIIWLDTNILIRGDLRPTIDAFLASGKHIGVIPHPLRSTVAEEGAECIKRRKDDADVILSQLERYRDIGFETNRLVETNLLMLRMDLPETKDFLSRWWSEIDRGSRRDQLSFNLAAETSKAELFELTEKPNSVRNHPDLALLHHDANRVTSSQMKAGRRLVFSDVRARLSHRAQTSVDIVICVHDALGAVRECLESVTKHRQPEHHRIILVDDGSTQLTRDYLRIFAASQPNVHLIRRPEAEGYTKSANEGLRSSSAELVILLNSDTIVAKQFVEKLADAAAFAPGIGIVGPLSNAASAQSIPEIQGHGGQTAINALPPGKSVDDMDRWCEEHSPTRFPRVPLIHGFCFALSRATIDRIGYFDEASFPRGYGEENDYCFRASNAGIGLAIATHTYVFHAKAQSYGAAARRAIVARSDARVIDIHGKRRVEGSIVSLQQNPVLVELRREARTLYGWRGQQGGIGCRGLPLVIQP